MSMSCDYCCETRNLSIGYNSAIITDISIGVRRGEILTLIGPNGAGKSTLLKTLACELTPIDGAVYLNGDNIHSLPGSERAKKLALMLPQSPSTELTSCFELVSAGRYPYTGRLGILSKEDKQIVNDSLALVGASQLRDRDFSRLSDGQRQRVLLARALCQQPELILLDEPTSFLDIRGKLELLQLLKKLVREKNLAVIMSLHELDLAQKVSDRIVCVGSGSIIDFGTPDEVFTEDKIRRLYGLNNGSYSPLYSSLELCAPEGLPEVFVIGGGGRGINIYRRLTREGTAFITGILYENDIELPAASALAHEVITHCACTLPDEEKISYAKNKMLSCRRIICANSPEGIMSGFNTELLHAAQKAGRTVEYVF